MPEVRIGWGYDIHRLYPGYPTVLAGVEFPDFPHGFNTHSDGDVVAHAIIDALAGALAVGSLGDYFPEDDPADQDARSIEFLERFRPVMAKHARRSSTSTARSSAPLRESAQPPPRCAATSRPASAATLDRVNVKGKTNDGFGPEGEARRSRRPSSCSSRVEASED